MNKYPYANREENAQNAPTPIQNQSAEPSEASTASMQNQPDEAQKSAHVAQKPIYTPVPPIVEPPRERVRYALFDTLFAWISVLAGVLFARALPATRYPLGASLALLLLLSLAVVYLLRGKKKLPPALWCIVGYAALLTLGLLTGENTAVRRWLVLVVLLAPAVLSCLAYGLCGKGKWSGAHLFFTLCAVISTPVLSFPHLFGAISARHGGEGRNTWRTVGWCALGLAAAALPSAIIIGVLSYDAQFTALLDRIFSVQIDGLGPWIGDLFLGLIFAVLLFGLLFGGKLREARRDPNAAEKKAPRLQVLPRALICAFVTPILLIYVIFFISQWSYYVSAFTHTLPEGLTFSEYARDGFFQLCGVSAFNAVMLFHVHLLMRVKKEGRDPLRTLYTVLISLATLVLIATALSKMVLYIDSYGLTQKRVYASWFMIVLAVIFLLTLVAQACRRLHLSLILPICCALLFSLIAIPNIDGMIANYNVNAYLEGELADVDIHTVRDFGASGVPALIRLEDALQEKDALTEKEQALLQDTSYTLVCISNELDAEDDTIFSFDVPTHRARRLLKARSAAGD